MTVTCSWRCSWFLGEKVEMSYITRKNMVRNGRTYLKKKKLVRRRMERQENTTKQQEID
jgi:hypothetical protein